MRYVTLQMVTMAGMIAAFFPGPKDRLWPNHPAADALGCLLLVAAAALVTAGFVTIRPTFRVRPDPRPDGRLVTGGVYGRFRHPMYTSLALVAVSLVLLRPSWPMIGAGIASVAVVVWKSRHEERLLAERYSEYAAYRKKARGVLGARG